MDFHCGWIKSTAFKLQQEIFIFSNNFLLVTKLSAGIDAWKYCKMPLKRGF